MINHVCVVGLGYVGIPLIYALREAGYLHVTGVDIQLSRVMALREGYDPTGIVPQELVLSEYRNIGWTIDVPAEADAYFVCVPTPDAEGKPDYQYVDAAVQSIAAVAKEYAVIVLESTVAPGTCQDRLRPMLDSSGRKDIQLFFSPERINPSSMAYYAMRKHTKALACDEHTQSFDEVARLYAKIFDGVALFHDTRVCELAKCFENAQRDTNIALMNELSMHCCAAAINYDEVVRALRTKPSSPVFHSGIVGGHCIPVDPYYLKDWYDTVRASDSPTVIGQGRETNEIFVKFVAALALASHAQTRRVLIIGETYKPDVADKRNAGAAKLVAQLEDSVDVYVYDPLTGAKVVEVEPFGCVIGLVNHECLLPVTFSTAFPITTDATFINVGGFSARQITGFSQIFNL